MLESSFSILHHPVDGNKMPIDADPGVVEIFVVPAIIMPWAMDHSIMAWNGNNSHDDNAPYPSFHPLLLTSSLPKTGGRSSPCIADKSKRLNKGSSPCDNNTMNLPPTTYTSTDKNNTTSLLPTAFTSPSHRSTTLRSVSTLEEMKSYVYNNMSTADNSQPPIFSTDNIPG